MYSHANVTVSVPAYWVPDPAALSNCPYVGPIQRSWIPRLDSQSQVLSLDTERACCQLSSQTSPLNYQDKLLDWYFRRVFLPVHSPWFPMCPILIVISYNKHIADPCTFLHQHCPEHSLHRPNSQRTHRYKSSQSRAPPYFYVRWCWNLGS